MPPSSANPLPFLMSGQSFQEALNHGVLVFDGAMGTEMYRHHVFTNRCFDELCLSEPKLIRQIHAEYRDAGADVLTTNTFGANRASWQSSLWRKNCPILFAPRSLCPRSGGAARRPCLWPVRSVRFRASPRVTRRSTTWSSSRPRADRRRGRFHSLRDATESGGPGTLRGRDPTVARRAFCAFFRHRRRR